MLASTEDIKKVASEKALQRLEILSKHDNGERFLAADGNIYDGNGQLVAEEPSQEQKEWVERRMRGPARSWERWFVGQYFTEEQKQELGLTDEDIAGRGMA